MPSELVDLMRVVEERLKVVDVAGEAAVKLVGDGVVVSFDTRDSIDGGNMFDMVKKKRKCVCFILCLHQSRHCCQMSILLSSLKG